MPRYRQLRIGGINLVTHPHSPQKYVELIEALFDLRRPVSIRGDQRLMLGELRALNSDDPLAGLVGFFYRFTHIDSDARWFNIERHKAATESEMRRISIPPNLQPNLAEFSFVFYPRKHLFYFERQQSGTSLSPLAAFTLFEKLANLDEIKERFGKIDLTVLPDKSTLDRIFKMHRLAHLSIDLSLPNPDDGGDLDEEFFDRLRRQGARRMHQELVADVAQTITPNEDTRNLAIVAARNGSVTGGGYDVAGIKQEESTAKGAWSKTIRYSPDLQTVTDALVSATVGLTADAH